MGPYSRNIIRIGDTSCVHPSDAHNLKRWGQNVGNFTIPTAVRMCPSVRPNFRVQTLGSPIFEFEHLARRTDLLRCKGTLIGNQDTTTSSLDELIHNYKG